MRASRRNRSVATDRRLRDKLKSFALTILPVLLCGNVSTLGPTNYSISKSSSLLLGSDSHPQIEATNNQLQDLLRGEDSTRLNAGKSVKERLRSWLTDKEFGYLKAFEELSDEDSDFIYARYFSALMEAWDKGLFHVSSLQLADGNEDEEFELLDIDPSSSANLLIRSKSELKLARLEREKPELVTIPTSNDFYGLLTTAAFVNSFSEFKSSHLLLCFERAVFLIPIEEAENFDPSSAIKISSKAFDVLIRVEDPFDRHGHGGLLMLSNSTDDEENYSNPTVSFFSERELEISWTYRAPTSQNQMGELVTVLTNGNQVFIAYERNITSVRPFTSGVLASQMIGEGNVTDKEVTINGLFHHPSDLDFFTLTLSDCSVLTLSSQSTEIIDESKLKGANECHSPIMSSDGKFLITKGESEQIIPVIRNPIQELRPLKILENVDAISSLGGDNDSFVFVSKQGDLEVFDLGRSTIQLQASIDCTRARSKTEICVENKSPIDFPSHTNLMRNPWDSNHILIENSGSVQIWNTQIGLGKSLSIDGFIDGKNDVFRHPIDPNIYYLLSSKGRLAKIDFWLAAQQIFADSARSGL